MLVSQISLVLLSFQGLAAAVVIPENEGIKDLSAREPAQYAAVEFPRGLVPGEEEPDEDTEVARGVNGDMILYNSNGIEKRQAQAIFFGVARIVLRRVIPAVIRGIIKIILGNEKRRAFIKQATEQIAHDGQLQGQGQQGVAICDSHPMGSNYNASTYPSTKTTVASVDYFCFALPLPVSYFRNGDGGDINWGWVGFNGAKCDQQDMGSTVTRLHCGNIPAGTAPQYPYLPATAVVINE